MSERKEVHAATANDVTSILGEMDAAKLTEIVSLRPTLRDLEEVRMFVAGDRDVFGAGVALAGVPACILEIVTEDEVDVDR